MFDQKKLASRPIFVRRIVKSLVLASGLIGVALFIGVFGYHWIAGFSWVDSLLEGSMILGGMGPVNPLRSQGAKIFASFYALFSGLIFIAVMGIVVAPILHRMLHKIHIDEQDLQPKSKTKK